MTDDLLRAFAELNPVVDPDRLVAFDAPELRADPVLRAVLEHAWTDSGRPDPVRPVDVPDPRPAHTRGATQGESGDMRATEVRPDQQPTANRRPRTLVAVGAAAAVILVMVAGLVVVNDRDQAPVVSSESAMTIYGDGDIHCPDHVANDRSLPVGTVEYHPGGGEIRVIVTLTDAAPDRDYGVNLLSEEDCDGWAVGGNYQGGQMTTDGNGAGELDHVFTGIEPGTYRVNVNLVTGLGLDDVRHREMGAAAFTEVVVDGNGGR